MFFLLTYLLDESDNDSFLFWGTTAADDSWTSGGKLHNLLHIELKTFLEKKKSNVKLLSKKQAKYL